MKYIIPKDLSELLEFSYNSIQPINEKLKDPELGLKATAWIAYIDDEERKFNITIPKELLGVERQAIEDDDSAEDYIGPSIDEGFRISRQFSQRNRLLVSYDLASCLIVRNDKSKQFLFYVGNGSVKGVWNDVPYPAIWYTHTAPKDREKILYLYREEVLTKGFQTNIVFDDELQKEIFKMLPGDNKNHLNKILENLR